jgi:catechol 2,3-dioxygenase-like lactoylglutathione lyase family enzyme
VLLRDPVSGQRLELNWYHDGSRFATRYEPGEGLDHIGVKVQDVVTKLRELASKGIGVAPVPDSLGEQELGHTLTLHIGFVKDPDGN